MGLMQDKVVIVTGAASGIGETTAEAFAAEGARVIVADVTVEAGEKVAGRIGGLFVRTDVAQAAEVNALVSGAVARYGRLDTIFNNAGVVRVAKITEATDDEFALMMSINVGGVFHGIRAAAAVMRAQGFGTIVSTASIGGVSPIAGMSIYSATKAAVISLTKAAAIELAPFGVRVNAVCPGTIPTPLAVQMGMTDADMARLAAWQPIGRVGLTREIADAVLYLASDRSTYVTGHALVVDGAMTAGIHAPP